MMAPMEGVIDHTMRELLTAIGGVDRCVTEFVRITTQPLPERVFKRYCPELNQHSLTSSGTPVYIQLLGDNPEMMAANAAKAAGLGACGIDLNYGCPAKTVNSSGGGSFMLQKPELLYQVTQAVRAAVPVEIPVTAKIRLGYRDKSLASEIALAIEAAGASEIAIHGRTKVEGYRPPAYWEQIGLLTERLSIPVIANGEIWNLHDLQRCIRESGTPRIMLGRGLVACPDLALLARTPDAMALHWGDICLLLLHYFAQLQSHCDDKYLNSLIKQWLIYLRVQYADAHLFFEQVKRLRNPHEMQQAIMAELNRQQQRFAISGHIGRLNLCELLEQPDHAA